MKTYKNTKSFKISNEENAIFEELKINSNFIRKAVFEKIGKDKLYKKDNRKKYTLQDLKNSLNL